MNVFGGPAAAEARASVGSASWHSQASRAEC